MDKIFIDTNIFQKNGFNFDKKNPIIGLLMKNIKEKKYEYCNLSVIDNEIISHINQRIDENKKYLKKLKWVEKNLDKKIINENINKIMLDYDEFKKNVCAKNCDVSKINPEVIFHKYFNIIYPFETKKKDEFPDAFIAEFINNLNVENKENVYVITNDKGFAKSLNENIIVFNSIELFLEKFNNVDSKEYQKICKFILKNKKNLEKEIFNRIAIDYSDLIEPIVDLHNINFNEIIDIKVIEKNTNEYYINCICDELILDGNFCCNDYFKFKGKIIYTNDCLEVDKIKIPNYEFNLIIKVDSNDEFSFEFFTYYDLKIYLKMFLDFCYNSENDIGSSCDFI